MTIRWGIIGCGDVTEKKSGPAFKNARGSALVAVMRRNGRLAEDYAKRHGVARWYDDADRLIGDPEVDAVYIAAPPGVHLEYALKVSEANKPAYVEKPMARNHAECDTMVKAFQRRRLPLFVAYYRRALDRFQKARELVVSGQLGCVTSVRLTYAAPHHMKIDTENLPWRLQAEHSGGGLFLDLACHTLDVLDYVVGPLVDVRGAAVNLATPCAVEDVVTMQFRTQSGGLGTGVWNFSSGFRRDAIEIAGTEGEITLSTFGNEPMKLRWGSEVLEFDLPNPVHIQQPLIQTIVDELAGDGTCPSTGVSAARTSRVIDQVLAGYYGGRDDAFWSRRDTWPGSRR
jgi:1,5-anhydro-D-fructose reductase (1,5-anhydro-D-mannitol-forming)